MKRFFKFALVALATAAVAVACQKPEQQPEKIALKGISLNKQAVELAIGAKETLTVKFDPENVTEKPTIEWSSSAPAVATVAEGEVTAVAAGEATITAKAGSFTATCKVTVKGEEQPEPGDFTSPDWANIGAITNGNHTFKFTKDDKNAYFFSERTSEGRYNDIWGGNGYIYFALDFDNDLTTGVELNGNGKYEYIGFIYCFGEKPKVEIVKAGDCLPEEYTVENIIARGSADDNSVKVEYCVPLADLPQLPENFTIYTWGNKDMAKVIYKYPYEEPQYEHNYTPGEEYLADNNLWKPVQDHVVFVAGGKKGYAADFDNISAEQSTYKFSFKDATSGEWDNLVFMYPDDEHPIPLASDTQYRLKMTLYSNHDAPRAFVKITRNRPDKGDNREGEPIWEPNPILGFKAGEPVEYVSEAFFGKPKWKDDGQTDEVKNVAFTFAFGGAPANTDIYIKDIILVPVEGGDQTDYHDTFTDYTPSAEYLAETNLWKAVDANHSYDWAGMPATFEQSTYSIKLPEASDAYWSTQFRIIPNEDFIVYPASEKTYKFSCKIYSSTGTKVWIKMHPGLNIHWPEAFETAGAESPADRIAVDAQETKTIEFLVNADNNFLTEPTNELLLFDLCPHNAENMIHIKDIIFEEVSGDVPPAGLNVDVLDMEFTAVDKTSNSYFDWSDRAGAASTAIYAGQSSTGTGQYIQLRTKNNNSGIITTASGGKLRQVTVAFNSATTDRKINVYAKNTAYTSPTDLYDDTKAGTLLGSIQAGSGNYTIDVTDDYAFVGLRSADGAIYVDKIEIAWEPGGDVPPAPAGIKIDGDFSDWADVPGFESSGNTTKEWKFASDDENIYLYFKIVRSDVIASKTDDPADSGIFPYNWRRYCTFIIDTDNNPATGTDKTYKDLHLTGAEAWGLFYPFRGNANTASGTDGNPSVVNGVDEQGGVETPSTDKVKVYGVVEEDFAYLEAEISRASIGSPASGKMTIQVGLSYNNPDPQEVTLK